MQARTRWSSAVTPKSQPASCAPALQHVPVSPSAASGEAATACTAPICTSPCGALRCAQRTAVRQQCKKRIIEGLRARLCIRCAGVLCALCAACSHPNCVDRPLRPACRFLSDDDTASSAAGTCRQPALRPAVAAGVSGALEAGPAEAPLSTVPPVASWTACVCGGTGVAQWKCNMAVDTSWACLSAVGLLEP